MINRSELKGKAKSALQGKRGTMALTMLLYLVLSFAAGLVAIIPIIGFIGTLLIAPALGLGLIIMTLKVARLESIQVSDLFNGFNYILKAFGITFMVGLFTFLWSLLLIIPGIIASYRYSMALYILADNPQIGVMEAITQSKEMTYGYKGSLFVLQLSFIGWAILANFTFGILYLWLLPYMYVTYSYFYLKIKGGSGGNIVEPVVSPSIRPAINPVVEPVVIPKVTPTVTPTIMPVVTPVIIPDIEPVVEPIVEPVVESVIEPVVEPIVESVVEPVVDPVVEPIVEPVVEPVVESVVEPVAEPTVKPVLDPTIEPEVESEIKPDDE